MSRPLLIAFALTSITACRPRPEPPAPVVASDTAPETPGDTASAPVAAGVRREPVETTVFHLHKFLQRIGVERDTFTPDGAGELEAKASFGFQDRGSQVTLAASFRLGPDGVPRDYQAWGRTSRITSVDERITREPDGSFAQRRLGRCRRGRSRPRRSRSPRGTRRCSPRT